MRALWIILSIISIGVAIFAGVIVVTAYNTWSSPDSGPMLIEEAAGALRGGGGLLAGAIAVAVFGLYKFFRSR